MNIEELYAIYEKYPKIITDSRKATAGSIFFALKGENFDGNNFAKDALNICQYAVVDNPDVAINERYILVDNVLHTLQNLAVHHRKQFDIPIIAVTGTNGKTTTKELIAEVLRMKYKVYATEGNLNNHIGVPLTLLKITGTYDMAIIEMGANKAGDIKELCEIAQPTHGIITNVGKAHLEGFGTFEKVMETKGELYDYLYIHEGTAFVNYDNEYLEDMNPPKKTIHYGVSRFTHCQGLIIKSIPAVNFRWIATGEMVYDDAELDWRAEERQIQLKLIGSYNFENALAAVCIGNYFDISDQAIKTALENYEPNNYRSQYIKTDQNVLVVDSYNANPTSMKISIDDFIQMEGNNKVLILGDMLELGRVSSREHDVLIHYVTELDNVEALYFVGSQFYELKQEDNAHWFRDVDELVSYVKAHPVKGKTIFLKGSRGITLEKILPLL